MRAERRGMMWAALLWLTATAARAAIPAPSVEISHAQADRFFGGRDARMVVAMTEDGKDTADLYLIDFRNDPLRAAKIRGGARTIYGDPRLSPDGTRVVYAVVGNQQYRPRETVGVRDGGGIRLCRAEPDGPEETVVADTGYSPTWWVHPRTGDEYIVYVDFPQQGEGWLDGKTFIRKVKRGTTQVEGPAQVLLEDYAFRHGRSIDGRYMVSNWPGWGIAELDPLATEKAFVHMEYIGGRSCMGTASQDMGYPANMLWFTVGHGDVWSDIWEPKRLRPYPEPYNSAQYNRWSNHHDFFSICLLNNAEGGSNEWNASTNSAGVYRFSTREWAVITKGSRGNSLWVGGPAVKAPPYFEANGRRVPRESGRSHAYAFTRSAVVAIGTDDGSSVLYTFVDTLPLSQWTRYAGPFTVEQSTYLCAVGVPPDPSRGDTSAMAKIRLQKSPWYDGVVFGTPGRTENRLLGNSGQFFYALDGNSSTAFIAHTPVHYDAYAGIDLGAPRLAKRISYTLSTWDRSGANISKEMTGGTFQGSNERYNAGYEDLAIVGTTPQTGGAITLNTTKAYRYYRYLAPRSPKSDGPHYPCIGDMVIEFAEGGLDPVQAPSIVPHGGQVDGPVQVKITTTTAGAAIHYTLDVSVPTSSSFPYTTPITITPPATVKAVAIKDGLVSAVDVATFTRSAAQVAKPVITPASSPFTGSTVVTITCATSGAAMRYTIDGSIPGPGSPAYAAPFTMSATGVIRARAYKDGMGESEVAYTAVVNSDDLVSGQDGRVLFPNGGGAFKVGDTVAVTWATFDPDAFYDAEIDISVDGGRNWMAITGDRTVAMADASWGSFRWVVRPEIEGVSPVSAQCLVRLRQYNGPEIDRSDAVFTIGDGLHVRPGDRAGTRAALGLSRGSGRGRDLLVTIGANCPYRVSVYDLSGRRIAHLTGTASATGAVAIRLPLGICVVDARVNGQRRPLKTPGLDRHGL